MFPLQSNGRSVSSAENDEKKDPLGILASQIAATTTRVLIFKVPRSTKVEKR